MLLVLFVLLALMACVCFRCAPRGAHAKGYGAGGYCGLPSSPVVSRWGRRSTRAPPRFSLSRSLDAAADAVEVFDEGLRYVFRAVDVLQLRLSEMGIVEVYGDVVFEDVRSFFALFRNSRRLSFRAANSRPTCAAAIAFCVHCFCPSFSVLSFKVCFYFFSKVRFRGKISWRFKPYCCRKSPAAHRAARRLVVAGEESGALVDTRQSRRAAGRSTWRRKSLQLAKGDSFPLEWGSARSSACRCACRTGSGRFGTAGLLCSGSAGRGGSDVAVAVLKGDTLGSLRLTMTRRRAVIVVEEEVDVPGEDVAAAVELPEDDARCRRAVWIA